MRGWLPAVLITAALALSGCGEVQLNDDIQTTVEPDENQSEQTEKLTFDNVNIIEINGKQLSLPFTVDELGEEFSIGEEVWSDRNQNILKFNEDIIAYIDIDTNNKIKSLSIDDELMEKYEIKVCGLNCQNNFNEIIDILGTPSHASEFGRKGYADHLLYEYSDGEIFIISSNYKDGFDYITISYI